MDTGVLGVMLDVETVPDAGPLINQDAVAELELVSGASEDEDLLPQRSRRERKPVLRLSYDELGKPSDQPLGILSRGVLIGSGTYLAGSRRLCNTLWCHPMALCTDCCQVKTSSRTAKVQVV